MTTRKVKIVCISDTHGRHQDVVVPDGDVLIHAGDWTHFGKQRDADDFNAWLGTLPHQHKIVVNGNHESNATWKRQVKTILSNATHLVNETVTVRVGGGGGGGGDGGGDAGGAAAAAAPEAEEEEEADMDFDLFD